MPGGVGGQHRVRARRAPRTREDLVLELQPLRHRLQHEVRALERGRRGRSRTVTAAVAARRLEPVEHAAGQLDAGLRALERLGADVVQRGRRCPRGPAPRPCRVPSSRCRSPLHVSTLPLALLLQFLDAPPDALGRQRQFGHGHACVGERVHDRRRDRRQRPLAATLRAVRARGRRRSRRSRTSSRPERPRTSVRGSRAACR